MECCGHINEFPEERIWDFEKNFRKKDLKIFHSSMGFLGEDDQLMDIFTQDVQTLENHGITVKQIAQRLRTIVEKYKRKRNLLNHFNVNFNPKIEALHKEQIEKLDRSLLDIKSNHGYPYYNYTVKNDRYMIIENRYLVSAVEYWGFQACPFTGGLNNIDGHYVLYRKKYGGSMDFTVIDLLTKKVLVFNDLLIHMIEAHTFFEGHVHHRLDPLEVIEFFNLQPGVDYSPQIDSQYEFIEIQEGGQIESIKTNTSETQAEIHIYTQEEIEILLADENYHKKDEIPYLYVKIINAKENDECLKTEIQIPTSESQESQIIPLVHFLGCRSKYIIPGIVTNAYSFKKYKRELVQFVKIEEEFEILEVS